MYNRPLATMLIVLAWAWQAAAQNPSGGTTNDQSPEEVRKAVDAIEAECAAGENGAAANACEVPPELDGVAVMRLTARLSPRIRQAYERKAAEEARYDFFIYNREAFSYGARTPFDYVRYHHNDWRSIEKTFSPQVFLRKEFYNTTSTSLSVGHDLFDYQSGHEGNAFVSGEISLPLFASREALERSNDKIYQQSQVNDARLEYYQEIREQISNALQDLAWAQRNQEELRLQTAHGNDLEQLLGVLGSVQGRDVSGDVAKVEAILTSVRAECESNANDLQIASEHLRNTIGIPFTADVKIGGGSFNPFEGETREELERVALETDEEIKTLLNSIRNAQAELELARKGRWDTTLVMGASRDFAGSGDVRGDAGYTLFGSVEVTHIDNRISRSLEQIALANIREYKNSIVDRRRDIHANIGAAHTNLVGQLAEVKSRESNLNKYREDYAKGIDLYTSGAITINELLQKRKDLRDEEDSISSARDNAHEAMATLMSSTGRYEQFLDEETRSQMRNSRNAMNPAGPDELLPAAVKDIEKLDR